MMGKWIKLIFVTVAMLATSATFAGSATIKAEDVKGFISVMEAMGENEAEFEGMSDEVPPMFDNDGSLMMFRGVLEQIKKDPVAGEKLSEVVDNAGFKSLEHWAEMGDKIMLTFMSVQSDAQSDEEKQAMHDMLNMTPEMISTIPESMRGVIESAQTMMKAMGNVTDADKAVLAPYVSKLEAAMME